MRRRFFIKQFENDRAVIDGDTAHHLGRVLRAEAGQLYELSDGQKVWLGRVASVARDRVEFALVEELPARRSAVDVKLLLAVVKFDAFEWAIEKATELGVNTIVPLAAARSEKALVAAAAKRAERWKKILVEASQQSRRVNLPILEPLARTEPCFAQCKEGLKLLLSENQDAPSMRTVLEGQKSSKAVIAIGPEGGWTDKELVSADQAGFKQVSLGNLLLRTETAVIASLANLNYVLGAK
ncbi:MAG: RsmE family RNA methyltransferase [Candidatus Acidiferrales bacterium]